MKSSEEKHSFFEEGAQSFPSRRELQGLLLVVDLDESGCTCNVLYYWAYTPFMQLINNIFEISQCLYALPLIFFYIDDIYEILRL